MAKRKRARRRQRQEAPPEDTVSIIDRHLLAPVERTVNGTVTRITALEAIVLQLQRLELQGDVKASRVLLNYEDLSKKIGEKQVQLEFKEDTYTRSLTGESGNG